MGRREGGGPREGGGSCICLSLAVTPHHTSTKYVYSKSNYYANNQSYPKQRESLFNRYSHVHIQRLVTSIIYIYIQIQKCLKKYRIFSLCLYIYMGVSKNRGTPKSSILIGFSFINHPFWWFPYFWKHPYIYISVNATSMQTMYIKNNNL